LTEANLTVYCKQCYLNRNESGRFGALKSDSTHHCVSQGHYGFHSFPLLTDFVCLYNYEFWFSLCKIARSSVILLLPLFLKSELQFYALLILVFSWNLNDLYIRHNYILNGLVFPIIYKHYEFRFLFWHMKNK
jgi:hypothetical protein